MTLIKSGVPSRDELSTVIPPRQKLEKGPVVVVECFQEIPCNPCETACKQEAIRVPNINDIPIVDHELCNGCSLCISKCPGLAIFVIDETYSPNEVLVKIPYEFLPLPEEGDIVTALDREGKVLGDARVLKVQDGKYQDRTAVISITVAKDFSMEVRNIKVRG